MESQTASPAQKPNFFAVVRHGKRVDHEYDDEKLIWPREEGNELDQPLTKVGMQQALETG